MLDKKVFYRHGAREIVRSRNLTILTNSFLSRLHTISGDTKIKKKYTVKVSWPKYFKQFMAHKQYFGTVSEAFSYFIA